MHRHWHVMLRCLRRQLLIELALRVPAGCHWPLLTACGLQVLHVTFESAQHLPDAVPELLRRYGDTPT